MNSVISSELCSRVVKKYLGIRNTRLKEKSERVGSPLARAKARVYHLPCGVHPGRRSRAGSTALNSNPTRDPRRWVASLPSLRSERVGSPLARAKARVYRGGDFFRVQPKKIRKAKPSMLLQQHPEGAQACPRPKSIPLRKAKQLHLKDEASLGTPEGFPFLRFFRRKNRREWDSNPRNALTRLHAFQASSISHSDISP